LGVDGLGDPSCREHDFDPFFCQSLGDAGSAGIDVYWGEREGREGREGGGER